MIPIKTLSQFCKQRSNPSLRVGANEYTQDTFDKWLFSSGVLGFFLFFLSFWKYSNCQKIMIFFLKKKKKENERMWPFVFYICSGNKLHWLNARKRIMQSPIRLVCIFFQDDSLSLLATDGLWQLTTLAVMPVHDFICVTLHVTAAFFLFACRSYSPFQEHQKNRGFPCQNQKPKTALQALEKQYCWNIVVCLGL